MRLPGPAAPEWDRLATEASSIFATRAWQECWWTHYGEGSTPLVLTDDERSPSVILALHVRGRLLKTIRLVGHGTADELGPICGPSRRVDALSLMRAALADRELRWDVFVAHDVPVTDGWDRALDGSVLRGVGSPVITFQTDVWDDFLRGKSKNFREQLRRRERKLGKQFEVRVRMATAATLASDLETLFTLHVRRWGKDAPFASDRERAFHEDFASVALERGWLRLSVLELDGRPAAALYGFRFAGVEYFHQSGRDPSLDAHSVGSVLLFHTVRAAIEDGMSEYRLLRGDESYKSHLADVDRPVHTLAVANTVPGRVAVALARRRR